MDYTEFIKIMAEKKEKEQEDLNPLFMKYASEEEALAHLQTLVMLQRGDKIMIVNPETKTWVRAILLSWDKEGSSAIVGLYNEQKHVIDMRRITVNFMRLPE